MMTKLKEPKEHEGKLYHYGCEEHEEYGFKANSMCFQCKADLEWEDYLRDRDEIRD